MSNENAVEMKVKDTVAGIHRISWPTPKKTMRNTGIVLGWTVAVAALVFVVDMASNAGFQMLVHLAS